MVSYWFVVASLVCLGNSQLLQSLQNVIHYGISQNVSDLNFLIGVAIAKGQMQITKKYIKEDNKSKFVIKNLINKCEIVLKTARTSKDPLSGVLSSHLWTQDTPTQPSPHLPSSQSTLAGSSFLSPTLSDGCIRSLFTGCLLPPECLEAELSGMAHGYALTHQVLYWSIFDQVCHTIPVRTVLRFKCRRVVSEHLDISTQGLPQLLDLYFEQVVVCGLHGFYPLVTDQQILLSLQSSTGCFSLHKNKGQEVCDIHLSGVAAGALSLMIKFNIKEQL